MHQLWGSSFFWKCSKFCLHLKNAEKNSEKAFCFLDNCIWIGCIKFSLSRRENLWPAINVFTNIPKILHITKGNFFQLNCLVIDQLICQRCCRSDLNSVWARLPCCFSKRLQKRHFLDIYLTTVFQVRNYENTWAMGVIFFLKVFKTLSTFRKSRKKLQRKF